MYIVLDTNFLYGSFKEGVIVLHTYRLRMLLGLKKLLKFEIAIPSPVISELNRKAKERYNIFEDDNEQISSYRENLDKLIKENDFKIIPFPKKIPDMSVLFMAAVNKEAPFDKKGQSFRDAIIWYSVSEFAETNKKAKVLLVSEDKHVSGIARKNNLQTLRFDELKEKLEDLLPKETREKRKELRNKIKDYLLNNKLEEIRESIRMYHEFRIDVDSAESLLNVTDFIIRPVNKIDLIETDNRIVFTAFMNGDLVYSVNIFYKNKKKLFRIGEAFLQLENPVIESKVKQYIVFVDGVADYGNDTLGNISIQNIGRAELPKITV